MHPSGVWAAICACEGDAKGRGSGQSVVEGVEVISQVWDGGSLSWAGRERVGGLSGGGHE